MKSRRTKEYENGKQTHFYRFSHISFQADVTLAFKFYRSFFIDEALNMQITLFERFFLVVQA
jgi:hypothetical protein